MAKEWYLGLGPIFGSFRTFWNFCENDIRLGYYNFTKIFCQAQDNFKRINKEFSEVASMAE